MSRGGAKIEIPQYIFDYAFAKIQHRRPCRLAAANEHQLEHDQLAGYVWSQHNKPDINSNNQRERVFPADLSLDRADVFG
jgi:hypothetical protein